MNTEKPTELPDQLWHRIRTADQGNVEQCAELAQQIIKWADGRHPDQLGVLLDALRSQQSYMISLEVLEAAWNSTAPEGFRAQIAQDWVGTVLFGIGDLDGAQTVAAHIGDHAERMSPGFLSDFGDLLMEWGLLNAAYGILQNAMNRIPGDLSVRYNLGTCEKFFGNWQRAKQAFDFVSRHEADNEDVMHNLLIAAIACGDKALIDGVTERLKDRSSKTAWNIGENVQVEFKGTEEHAAEVLYAERVGAHQVRLRGIPQFQGTVCFDDLLLIDYKPQHYPNKGAEPLWCFPVLKVLDKGSYHRVDVPTAEYDDHAELAEQLADAGYPVRQEAHHQRVVVAVTPQSETEMRLIVAKIRAN